MWRRVLRLRNYFEHSEVAGFERINCPVSHSHEFVSLGRIEHGKYLARVWVYLRVIGKCIKPVKSSNVCYAFSLDILLLFYVLKLTTFSKTKLVYEVADIYSLLASKGSAGRLARRLERFLVKRSAAVVFTSEAFLSGYFSQVQRFASFPSIVIENKVSLPKSTRDSLRFSKPRGDCLRIGYFGLMKSPASFALLRQIAEAAQGAIKVVFRGRFVYPLDQSECLETINSYAWFEYGGPYQSPDDLESVYTSVDLVWDAYCEGENAMWQRTTRFSEACYFKRPLIYNPETQDGKLAEKYGLGVPISFDDPDVILKQLLAIDEAWLRERHNRFEALPSDLIFYESEYDELAKLLAD